jgi:hypothetical protein
MWICLWCWFWSQLNPIKKSEVTFLAIMEQCSLTYCSSWDKQCDNEKSFVGNVVGFTLLKQTSHLGD